MAFPINSTKSLKPISVTPAPTRATTPDTSEKIHFYDHHIPQLTQGQYRTRVTQKVKFTLPDGAVDEDFGGDKTYHFTVNGPRFILQEDDIKSVFPPDGSLGDHSDVLPHILLKRTTMPWERRPAKSLATSPWLLLMVFDADQIANTKVLPIEQIMSPGAKFPTIDITNNPDAAKSVTVIEVQKQLLETIMPKQKELPYLAHVRVNDTTHEEFAVIISNRLPVAGGTSSIHLVSVEGRFSAPDGEFNYQEATDNELIRLISLKSWRFACVAENQSFDALIRGVVEHHSTLRLPAVTHSNAETLLAQGYIPVAHQLRQGGNTVSLYRGPLLPGHGTTTGELPVRQSDALLHYDPSNGLFDVSYASAWELGRLLALQSKPFSTTLYQWKQTRGRALTQAKQDVEYPHPLITTGANLALPETVATWFDEIALLSGVPFNYLIPNEALLPVESIRFFWLDKHWINCLLDGAYSIGRVTQEDLRLDQIQNVHTTLNIVTGFLLRSEIVAGYPDLLIDAYNDVNVAQSTSSMPILRKVKLSPNTLLCLFSGEVQVVDFHQKPEALHFGLTLTENNNFQKILRTKQGDPATSPPTNGSFNDQRVVRINVLAGDMADQLGTSVNSAQFAFQMIEGAQRVRLIRG